ncbi:hypothetical protein GKZ68_20770 (plasmid) [Hymenobacter sp. BRD128]|uniref:hypothetical protein n=1 Tax=Hymenobacter sp. BRD128 TaxID=2675878 RepID=UPI0015658CDF|nr:hypothetical protein [Hymenobacter sp. BRD128]QKG59118.1 hypothetical protein GKZ68_20770 [Hymenobacter sp. BRD128]
MAVPTTRAALAAYIRQNPCLDQVTVADLSQGLAQHFQQHPALRLAVAQWLGMSRRERQWPQLVAQRYAISFCDCPQLAEVLLTGGYVAYPEPETLFQNLP